MILEFGNIKLRPFKKEDAKELAKIADNENIADNLRDGFPSPYSLNDAINFIDRCIEQNPITTFAIEFSGKYVGNIGLMNGEDVYRKSAEIGYFISKNFWGKGIATSAVKLMTDYGFQNLNIIRIHTGVYEYNTASMRVLEKCGFKKDCIFEKAVYKKNKIWNEHRYSLINPNQFDFDNE